MSPRPSKARAILGAVSLLVLGAVIGVAIDRHLHAGPPPGSAAALHDATMGALEDRLELTADQRRQIDSIVMARQGSLRNAWQRIHSQLGAAADSVHADVEAILTPEQRREFRAWLGETGAVH